MKINGNSQLINRRHILKQSGLAMAGISLLPNSSLLAQTTTDNNSTLIKSMEVFTVAVTPRTNWIIVRLNTNGGISGLGEASLGRRTEFPELQQFFDLIEGESALDIQLYRQRARTRASSGDRVLATAFSSIEQALWDITGKVLDVPVYQLFGGKLRSSLPVYANINRATIDRSPQGFAAKASQAIDEGFNAIKAAPFDGFPSLDSDARELNRAVDLGIACVMAMRESIGEAAKLKIDAHSNFDVELSIEVADQLESANLSWYEEPISPTETQNTKTIHDAISQPLAGGEFMFGIEGFGPLCESRAVDIIMPDVKHCGGLLEAVKISALAEYAGITVSPHNPSGPISTAASVSLCASLANFEILEYQWGEAAWRKDLIQSPEVFFAGSIAVNDGPGLGIELNERVLRAHML